MKRFIFLLFSLIFASCNDIFDTHPYDMNFDGDRDINQCNIKIIESICKEKDSLKVAFIGDTHGWYSDTRDMVSKLNETSELDFVVHLGDLTDCGTTKEYIWTRELLSKIKVPYIALIGNHDFLGTGDQMYQKMYGELDFSFIAGRIKIVCLNTNATEYDYLAAVPNLDFMENEIYSDNDKFDRSIICMHSRPFCEQFNNNVAKVFQLYVKSMPGLMFCVNGHDHRTSQIDLYNDGVIYYGVNSSENRSYLLFTITQEGYSHEIVCY